MTPSHPSYEELASRLNAAEAVVEALRTEQVDAVIGQRNLLLLRLQETARALRESERKFRILAENTYDWEFWLGPGYRFEYTPPACERITGYTAAELMSRPQLLFDMIDPSDADSVRTCLGRAAFRRLSDTVEYRITKPDGSGRWIALTVSPVVDPDGNYLGIRGSGRDITARKEAESERAALIEDLKTARDKLEERVLERTRQLEEANRQLRQAKSSLEEKRNKLQRLTAELMNAEEKERRRIANVLHDDLQQLLAAAKLKLDAALSETADPSHRKTFEVCHHLINESIQITRNLSHDLTPPALSTGSLFHALGWIKETAEKRHGLQISLELPESDIPCPDPIGLSIYPSVQELLFNVVKHAGTRKVRVRLNHNVNDAIQVEVADEGNGFIPELSATKGIGLFNIQQRLGLLNGRMEVFSSPGRGTRVVLHVPYPEPGEFDSST